MVELLSRYTVLDVRYEIHRGPGAAVNVERGGAIERAACSCVAWPLNLFTSRRTGLRDLSYFTLSLVKCRGCQRREW